MPVNICDLPVPALGETETTVGESIGWFTWKLLETDVADRYDALPNCEAVIVQVPGAESAAVVPDTVQTEVVEELKLTGRVELADALSASEVPSVWLAMLAKVMDWPDFEGLVPPLITVTALACEFAT